MRGAGHRASAASGRAAQSVTAGMTGGIRLTPQSEAGKRADRWFGLIRNVVLAANLAAAVHFAGLSYWASRHYSANYDAYRAGQVGAIWSGVQIGLIALLGLINW